MNLEDVLKSVATVPFHYCPDCSNAYESLEALRQHRDESHGARGGPKASSPTVRAEGARGGGGRGRSRGSHPAATSSSGTGPPPSRAPHPHGAVAHVPQGGQHYPFPSSYGGQPYQMYGQPGVVPRGGRGGPSNAPHAAHHQPPPGNHYGHQHAAQHSYGAPPFHQPHGAYAAYQPTGGYQAAVGTGSWGGLPQHASQHYGQQYGAAGRGAASAHSHQPHQAAAPQVVVARGTFANSQYAHAAPNVVALPQGGGRGKPAPLQEGAGVNVGTRKHYDAIVKEFVDSNEQQLEFPSTLTPAERQLVHKLAMHFNLGHKSSGPANARVLRLYKEGGTAPAPHASEDVPAGPRFAKTVDMFQGLQRLADVLLRDHIQDVRAGAAAVYREMERTLNVAIRRTRDVLARRDARGHHHHGVSAIDRKAKPPGRPANLPSLDAFRQALPAARCKHDLLRLVKQHPVVIVAGDTGCGKTTQVPQFLLDEGGFNANDVIICTQPRRISAVSVASRVAQERGEAVGDSVGYTIRFESVTSSRTRLVYVTTGILLRMLHSNTGLAGVAAVVVDEVHERDVDTDFALLLLRDIIQTGKHPSLRVVVMSATINIEALQRYFTRGSAAAAGSAEMRDAPDRSGLKGASKKHRDPSSITRTQEEAEAFAAVAPVVSIKGTLFPVTEYFLEDACKWVGRPAPRPTGITSKAPKLAPAAAATSADNDDDEDDGRPSRYEQMRAQALAACDRDEGMRVDHELVAALIQYFHKKEGPQRRDGAILAFLPGWNDIDRVQKLLQACPFGRELSVLPLHGSLSTAEQNRVFLPPPRGFRKVVLATNVAETSITIDDVTFVVDSCLHKGTNYDHIGNTSSLAAQLIAQANGKQRRGRAGRVRAGDCVHLLCRTDYDALPAFNVPEMVRSPLEEVCLQLKAIAGEADCAEMMARTMDAPDPAAVKHSVTLLTDLGAFDSQQRLTHLGRVLASMPVHPTIGKMLLFAAALGVLEPVSVIAAALGAKSPFVKPMAHQLVESRRALEQLDAGQLSDHLTVLKLFQEWSASRSPSDYAFQHWADNTQLRSMARTKDQLSRLVATSGFLRHQSRDWASRNSKNVELVRFVIAYALYPRLLVVETKRGKRHRNWFCFDNKPCEGHPSSVLGGRNAKHDVEGREYIAFFERMRVESTLFVFDGTAISRLAVLLSARELDLVPAYSIPPEVAEDADCKYDAAPCDPAARPGPHEDTVLVLSSCGHHGIKRFLATREEAIAIAQLRDAIEFFFARSILHVDAALFPNQLIAVLARALGDPVVNDTAVATAPSHPSTDPASGGRRSDDDDDDDGGDGDARQAAARRRGGDDDKAGEDEDDDDEGGVSYDVEVVAEITLAEADLLTRAFGDLLWVHKHTAVGATTAASPPRHAVKPTDAADKAADVGKAADVVDDVRKPAAAHGDEEDGARSSSGEGSDIDAAGKSSSDSDDEEVLWNGGWPSAP